MKKLYSLLLIIILALSCVYSTTGYLAVPVEIVSSSGSSTGGIMPVVIFGAVASGWEALKNYMGSKPNIIIYENKEKPNTALVEIIGKEGAVFTYTTNGTKATTDSIPYQGIFEVEIGKELSICAKFDNGETVNNTFTISRENAPPIRQIIDEKNGSGIEFNIEEGEVFYFINYRDNPVELGSFVLSSSESAYWKEQSVWIKYDEPIYFKNLDCSYFSIYYSYYGNDSSKLSSLVYGTNYRIYPGAAYTNVFYDKGFYSDGWRYLEVCPYKLNETKWGSNNILTGLTTNEIGSGYENTNKLCELIGNIDETIQSTVYTAKSAQNACIFENQ